MSEARDMGPESRGKVRDIYDLGEQLLLVATDRISAFDVVLAEPIPHKGEVLTKLSLHWLDLLADVVPNHLISADVADLPKRFAADADWLAGRFMLVKKARVFPIECIVRGYLAGSGWAEYQRSGTVCGMALPPRLRESSRLPQPMFTPSTKAEIGAHDENISFERMSELLGPEKAKKVKDLSLAVYDKARGIAEQKGIIIADTKFEMGDYNGRLILIDEVLTPDSSRFWPKATYQEGVSQPSFDKQFVRDYLNTLDWNKQAPGPQLPNEVVKRTSEKYLEALEKLTGIKT